ncbi:hypothetical protein SCUP234_05727 [Seiridium cupressi]
MSSYNSFGDVSIGLPEQSLFNQPAGPLDPYGGENAEVTRLTTQELNQSTIQSTLMNHPMAAPSPAGTIQSSSQGSSTGTKASTRTGLYATSTDGARVACTARTERPHHMIYGATTLGSISDTREKIVDDALDIQFPSLDEIIPPETDFAKNLVDSATSANEWTEGLSKYDSTTTLNAAVSSLFIDKVLKSDTGGLASLLILHGIYQEILKVKGYHARSLSSWVPSMQWPSQSPPNSHDLRASESEGAFNISNWRNAALDCVDILHWSANATIAKAAGIEHPNVLHLHFARVVLLAPYQSIQTLARSIVETYTQPRSNDRLTSRDEVALAEQDILRWAQQDEHKARYSRDAFYEPVSAYLVTLTLWAYSSYSSRAPPANGQHHRFQSRPENSQPHNSHKFATAAAVGDSIQPNDSIDDPLCVVNIEDDENREPTFIRLDRPNDDEMVQLFVRKGRPSTMTAHIAGVGNICSAQGPIKILREGRKILSNVSSAWGRNREQISILEAMEKTMIGKR